MLGKAWLVSWVRCGTCLYRFLIFVLFLTSNPSMATWSFSLQCWFSKAVNSYWWKYSFATKYSTLCDHMNANKYHISQNSIVQICLFTVSVFIENVSFLVAQLILISDGIKHVLQVQIGRHRYETFSHISTQKMSWVLNRTVSNETVLLNTHILSFKLVDKKLTTLYTI